MDRVAPETRSRNMSRVRNRDTGPEMVVRRALHARGFRYRLHRKELPGRPDVILPRYRVAVLVHGCFWHGHDCARGKRPASNREFWTAKLDRNLERDRRAEAGLRELGWNVWVIWECGLESGVAALLAELEARRNQASTDSIR
ncbi:very short patch repair endonuclease [Sphingomonas sp. ID0503]|uniref:very short patch repair endonuclease n=1 Tax=Sphingomonas sp. ID0503 TaxID=3399691 RepID=UPI003AFA465D